MFHSRIPKIMHAMQRLLPAKKYGEDALPTMRINALMGRAALPNCSTPVRDGILLEASKGLPPFSIPDGPGFRRRRETAPDPINK